MYLINNVDLIYGQLCFEMQCVLF